MGTLTQLSKKVPQNVVLVTRVPEIDASARRHSHLDFLPLERDAAPFPVASRGSSASIVGLVVGKSFGVGLLLGVNSDLVGKCDAGPRVRDKDGHRHVRIADFLVHVVRNGTVVRAVQIVDGNSIGFTGWSSGAKLKKKKRRPDMIKGLNSHYFAIHDYVCY